MNTMGQGYRRETTRSERFDRSIRESSLDIYIDAGREGHDRRTVLGARPPLTTRKMTAALGDVTPEFALAGKKKKKRGGNVHRCSEET